MRLYHTLMFQRFDTAPFRLLFDTTPLFKIISICYIYTLLLYFCIQMPTILFHEAKHDYQIVPRLPAQIRLYPALETLCAVPHGLC